MSGWYLSFDCATKTFAYSICRIDLDIEKRSGLWSKANALAELLRRPVEITTELVDAVLKLDVESKQLVQIVHGNTVDLCEGRADSEISTIERIRAVVAYVTDTVRPALKRVGVSAYHVIIEYQMGQNTRARAVATALVTLFATEDIIIVGPSLKNKIATCEAGRYCYFAEKYKTTYCANKAHSAFNLAQLESTFGTSIPYMSPVSKRGHIADSVMQIIGHLVHGSNSMQF